MFGRKRRGDGLRRTRPRQQPGRGGDHQGRAEERDRIHRWSKRNTSKVSAKTICVNPTTETLAGAPAAKASVRNICPTSAVAPMASSFHITFHSRTRAGSCVRGADEERDAADHRGNRREVDDDGARVEIAERVQPEHGDRGEERGRERSDDAEIPGLEVWLLHERDAEDADENGHDHLAAGEVAIKRPRQQRDPDREGVGQRDHVGDR